MRVINRQAPVTSVILYTTRLIFSISILILLAPRSNKDGYQLTPYRIIRRVLRSDPIVDWNSNKSSRPSENQFAPQRTMNLIAFYRDDHNLSFRNSDRRGEIVAAARSAISRCDSSLGRDFTLRLPRIVLSVDWLFLERTISAPFAFLSAVIDRVSLSFLSRETHAEIPD